MAAKIGVLDSGVGGLSVLTEIHRLLPAHSTIYFADQLHVPYGPRDLAEIDGFVDPIVQFLLRQEAHVIVLACHAASAASLYALRQRYPQTPFVGIEPAIKPAVKATRSGVVGVLTTLATANGQLYRALLERYADRARIMTQLAPELVRLVEEGNGESEAAQRALEHSLRPLLDAGADHIVLACTHFPFLKDRIQAIAGARVVVVDPGSAIARQVERVWSQPVSDIPAKHIYYTSGDPAAFRRALANLIGVDASAIHVRL